MPSNLLLLSFCGSELETIFLGDPFLIMSASFAYFILIYIATRLIASGLTINEILSTMTWTPLYSFMGYYAMLGIQASVPAVLAGHQSSARCMG